MTQSDLARTPGVHGTVWYPIDFSRGQIIAELPDDLDPRLMPPGSSPHFGSDDPAAVLLLDLIWPIWNLFDLTPEGRGDKWHPRLSY